MSVAFDNCDSARDLNSVPRDGSRRVNLRRPRETCFVANAHKDLYLKIETALAAPLRAGVVGYCPLVRVEASRAVYWAQESCHGLDLVFGRGRTFAHPDQNDFSHWVQCVDVDPSEGSHRNAELFGAWRLPLEICGERFGDMTHGVIRGIRRKPSSDWWPLEWGMWFWRDIVFHAAEGVLGAVSLGCKVGVLAGLGVLGGVAGVVRSALQVAMPPPAEVLRRQVNDAERNRHKALAAIATAQQRLDHVTHDCKQALARRRAHYSAEELRGEAFAWVNAEFRDVGAQLRQGEAALRQAQFQHNLARGRLQCLYGAKQPSGEEQGDSADTLWTAAGRKGLGEATTCDASH